MPDHKLLVFTGPIDAYFASQGMPKLEYRSIIFEVRNPRPLNIKVLALQILFIKA